MSHETARDWQRALDAQYKGPAQWIYENAAPSNREALSHPDFPPERRSEAMKFGEHTDRVPVSIFERASMEYTAGRISVDEYAAILARRDA